MVVSLNKGTPIKTPLYYSPYYETPKHGTVFWKTPRCVGDLELGCSALGLGVVEKALRDLEPQ